MMQLLKLLELIKCLGKACVADLNGVEGQDKRGAGSGDAGQIYIMSSTVTYLLMFDHTSCPLQ